VDIVENTPARGWIDSFQHERAHARGQEYTFRHALNFDPDLADQYLYGLAVEKALAMLGID
jgi:hypothetical protein